MTKPREQLSAEAAVLRVMGHLGAGRAAAIVGRSESLLRAWSDPDDERQIPVWAALALDAACIAAGAGAPFAEAFEAASRDVPALVWPARPTAPELLLARIMREAGQVAFAVDVALSNGRLSPADRRLIAKEARDVVTQCRDLIRSVERPS